MEFHRDNIEKTLVKLFLKGFQISIILIFLLSLYVSFVFSDFNPNIDKEKIEVLANNIKDSQKYKERLISMYDKVNYNILEKHDWLLSLEFFFDGKIEIVANEDESLFFAGTEAGPYVYVVSDGQWYDMMGDAAPNQTYWSVEYLAESQTIRFGTIGKRNT